MMKSIMALSGFCLLFLAGCAHQPAMGGSEDDAYIGSDNQSSFAGYAQPQGSADQSDRTRYQYPGLLSDAGPF